MSISVHLTLVDDRRWLLDGSSMAPRWQVLELVKNRIATLTDDSGRDAVPLLGGRGRTRRPKRLEVMPTSTTWEHQWLGVEGKVAAADVTPADPDELEALQVIILDASCLPQDGLFLMAFC